MAFRIEETFTVHAPPERVWRYLIDPRQVVECLPGAELVSAVDDRTFTGRVKVKVGPVTAAYEGQARLVEVDEGARRVRMTAEGRESAGAGSAKMTMTSLVTAADGGGSAVRVEAQLDVAGRIVQFGRGMIDTVNKQMFAQFTACVRTRLEAEASAPASDGSAGGVAAGAPPPASAARPVPLLTVLLRALWEMLARALGRRRG
ncbi:MAG TPA: SRPBCC family protein [Gemmatimonadaceae bacterium]